MNLAKRQKYRPQLAQIMQLSEANYALLMKLLANHERVGEVRDFAISELLHYQLSVNEVTKYTSVVTLTQHSTLAQNITNLTEPCMVIRLYHDARVAEVISSQAVTRVKPRYDYPNQQMHQPDEKQQISQFLKEWLNLCLSHGYAPKTVYQPQ